MPTHERNGMSPEEFERVREKLRAIVGSGEIPDTHDAATYYSEVFQDPLLGTESLGRNIDDAIIRLQARGKLDQRTKKVYSSVRI